MVQVSNFIQSGGVSVDTLVRLVRNSWYGVTKTKDPYTVVIG